MMAHYDASLDGFVLGRGTLYSPRAERWNGLYRWVGLADEDGEWQNIMPCQSEDSSVTENPWLETLGPGRLVFIPDKMPEVG